jgi:16S rRNA processing protein RimM
MIVGRIRRAHGIRGELVTEALTDDPETVFAVGRRLIAGTVSGEVEPDDAPLTVRHATPFKRGWIVRFDEITDRTTAEQWRDRYLLLESESLVPRAPDEVYYHELVGLRLERADGVVVGLVDAWYDMPTGLLLDVRTDQGSILVPYRPEVIVRVDVAGGAIVIDPPPGLLD